jgi:hypothetical protein
LPIRESFVLVRDTIDRQFAYSDLSAGVEANSVYPADTDRVACSRAEECDETFRTTGRPVL